MHSSQIEIFLNNSQLAFIIIIFFSTAEEGVIKINTFVKTLQQQ